ncbi:unnamed protein product [Vitrella brassicaformis CCMP3155]|uniref:Uncharacterized protein n=1 Tax=Vitrella brassicaformis (strain CCMP3155) TaxID=1169540 RepID=A0A0G4EEV8_VITBC|nr:unnamed protein product [Vitrella brassicaformis CCMP3155]|eukprot:CEL94228.1 unnamed protein product [Vitrella brassicaformis CCMP3155]
MDYEGPRPPRRPAVREAIDFTPTVVQFFGSTIHCRRLSDSPALLAHPSSTRDLLPPFATRESPYDCLCTRFLKCCVSKSRGTVNCLQWFPDGRRLITGTSNGDFTLWDGIDFGFFDLKQLNHSAVGALTWTHSEKTLISGNYTGEVHLYTPQLLSINIIQAHKSMIRDISLAPTDLKFVTAADDSHSILWDLHRGTADRSFTGHGYDVVCCEWHPHKGLIASGSKSAQVQLWDPRSENPINSMHLHKNALTKVKWSPSGDYLLTCGKDQSIKVVDLRTLSVAHTLRGHQADVTAAAWHPYHQSIVATGDYGGHLAYWDVSDPSGSPMATVPNAHDHCVLSLAWHPLGPIVASGGQDCTTRFWGRSLPGDEGEALVPQSDRPPTQYAPPRMANFTRTLPLKAARPNRQPTVPPSRTSTPAPKKASSADATAPALRMGFLRLQRGPASTLPGRHPGSRKLMSPPEPPTPPAEETAAAAAAAPAADGESKDGVSAAAAAGAAACGKRGPDDGPEVNGVDGGRGGGGGKGVKRVRIVEPVSDGMGGGQQGGNEEMVVDSQDQ